MVDKKKKVPDLLDAAKVILKRRPVRIIRGKEDVGFTIHITADEIQNLSDAIDAELVKRGKEKCEMMKKHQKKPAPPKPPTLPNGEASEKK